MKTLHEMTVDEWGNKIFSKAFIVKMINYDDGETIVYDTIEKITYSATYNGKNIILKALDDEKTT